MKIGRARGLVTFAALFVAVCGSRAQQPASAPGTGTVTGHVVCGDTGRPARFAGVMLFGVPPDRPEAPMPKPGDTAQVAAMQAAMKSAMTGMNMVQTQTELDGSYAAANVAPGDYYVFASVPGYVQPANQVQAAIAAGADAKKLLPGVPVVHVAADRTVSAEITATRGAAVAGKAVWDDGSPAAKAIMQVVPVGGKEKALPGQFAMLGMAGGIGGGGIMAITDDLGQFRIAGLAAGDYLLQATLQTRSTFAMQGGVMNMSGLMSETPLKLFAPGTPHRSEAKPLKLRAGEDEREVLLTIHLNAMRLVSGRISSAEDRHGLNSGTVTLEDTIDKEFKRTAGLDAAGNYVVSFVPPGTYNLTVTDAEDTEPSQKKQTGLMKFAQDRTLRSYDDGKATVIVSTADVTGQNLELAPSKEKKSKPDLNDLMKSLTAN